MARVRPRRRVTVTVARLRASSVSRNSEPPGLRLPHAPRLGPRWPAPDRSGGLSLAGQPSGVCPVCGRLVPLP